MSDQAFVTGNPETFAVEIEFEPDPDHGVGATREESLSWGGLAIWVNGGNVCLNQSDGEIRPTTRWYLLPVFEWLVNSWDAILHEERLPGIPRFSDARTNYLEGMIPNLSVFSDDATERQQENWELWWRRHALRSHRDGGLLPDLFIRRWRDLVEFSWGNSSLPGAPKDFLFLCPPGVARLDVRTVARTLQECLGNAIRYLVSRHPNSQRLQTLWKSWEEIPTRPAIAREAWFAKLGSSIEDSASLLEIARGAIQNESEKVIGSVFGSKTDDGLAITEESPAILMFTTVAPDVTQTDVRQLTKLIAHAYNDRGDETGLLRYTREVPVTTTFRTWVQGYELAQEFVGTMAQHYAGRALDIDLLVSQLGISTSDTEVADTTIRAFTIAGPQHRPTILSNRNCSWNDSQAGRRFTIAHELCHLLHDRPYGRQVATASGPWSPRDVEQRANAFAAMLLMPPDSVAEIIHRLDIPLASVEGIRRIAEAHQTSTFATIEHLYNLHQIDEADREMLRVEFEAVLTHSREQPTKRRIAPRPARQRRN